MNGWKRVAPLPAKRSPTAQLSFLLMAAMLVMNPWVRAWKTRFHAAGALAHAVPGVASPPAMASAPTAATIRSLILPPARFGSPLARTATAPAHPGHHSSENGRPARKFTRADLAQRTRFRRGG